MPYAPINGIELYYELHGSGPPLLFAHGQGGNHLSWWQQVPFFAPHYTCITFDHRAFGRSLDVESKGRASFSADVIGLLDHLEIEDVRVVAHSMGGRDAVSIAVRDPKQRGRALVLSGTSAGLGDEAIRERRAEAEEARGGLGLGAFSVAPSFKQAQPELDFLLREVSRLNPPRPRDFLRPRPLPPGTPAPTGNNLDRLAETGIPILYLVGQHDQITPPDMIEMCHRMVTGSRFAVVPDAGHSAYWEQPQRFNQVVMDFLRSVEPLAP